MFKKNFSTSYVVKMKTFKVIEPFLYDKLMGLLRMDKMEAQPMNDSNASDQTLINKDISENPQHEEIPTLSASVAIQPEKASECSCIMHRQVGEGIKRRPKENWLSFQHLTLKKKQQANKKKKKICVQKRRR